MRWLQERTFFESPLAMVLSVVAVFALLTVIVGVVLFLIFGVFGRAPGQVGGTASAGGGANAATLNTTQCYIVPRHSDLVLYSRPDTHYRVSNTTLRAGKPYLVRVIANDWYGVSWPDLAPGSTGYKRYRWVLPGRGDVRTRGDCTTAGTAVERTTAQAVLRQITLRDGNRVSTTTASNPADARLPYSAAYDLDGDTVADNVDNCPDAYGAAYNGGCPAGVTNTVDYDRDGIANNQDACPTRAGVLQLRGCPGEDPTTMVGDRDRDGVNDEADICPDVFGVIVLDGCPGGTSRATVGDHDLDGIDDHTDQCPYRYGPHVLNGCPGEDPRTMAADTDGDGIFDAEDLCPFDPGFLSNRGCP